MARQAQVAQVAPGPAALAGALVTWLAADPANFEQMVITGREILLAWNTDAAVDTYTVSVTSVADPFGRSGNITSEVILHGTIHMYGPFNVAGWGQTGRLLYFQGSNAAIKFAVIQLPT